MKKIIAFIVCTAMVLTSLTFVSCGRSLKYEDGYYYCAQNGVTYQMAEMSKVDHGGGGTISYVLANYGMEVIDGGVPVQNMHAPYEVVSKADVYEAYKGYAAFLKYMW